jgi:hypothetical protein
MPGPGKAKGKPAERGRGSLKAYANRLMAIREMFNSPFPETVQEASNLLAILWRENQQNLDFINELEVMLNELPPLKSKFQWMVDQPRASTQLRRVFLSYSRKDISFVRKLAEDLEKAGYDVWRDVSDLRSGNDWVRVIPKAIESAPYFLVVLSPNSIESEWVEKEYTQALSLRKKIIPILLAPTRVPFALNTINFVSFASGNYVDNLNTLLPALGYPNEKVAQKKAERKRSTVETTVAIRERLAQLPLATFLIVIGLSVFGLSLYGLSAISALLAGTFMIFRRTILANRFFIYSLLIYLVSASLSYFFYFGGFSILIGLLAILAGGSLFWYIFNPKHSSYYVLPYASISLALLLFIDGLAYLGLSIIPSILYAVLDLVVAFLIFTRK